MRDDMYSSNCEICGEQVHWTKEESFVIDYLIPNDETDTAHPERSLFFHPKCFITLAGLEWAVRCGYKLEKAPKAPRNPHKRRVVPAKSPPTYIDSPAQMEIKNVSFSGGQKEVSVFCYEIDGQTYYTVSEKKK